MSEYLSKKAVNEMNQAMKKKIAEIREWHEGKRDSFPQFTVFEAVGVMLDELDRIQQEYVEERAAHNAHVTELCELEYKIGELDSYTRMMHERNERLEKELRDAKAKIAVLERDNDMLEVSFSGIEEKLEVALDALEELKHADGEEVIHIIRQTIQAIKGEGSR